MPVDGGLECSVHDDIREIDGPEWDSLVRPGDLLASHRFVLACQSSRVEEARYWHVILRSGGHPVGTATLFRMDVSLDLLSGPRGRRAARWGRRLWPRLLRVPVLFCGLPVSLGQSTLRIAPGEDPGKVAAALTRIMEEIADGEGIELLCIKELSESERERWAAFGDSGYRIFHSLPYCTLPLRWKRLEEYGDSLRSGYRRQLRATLGLSETAFTLRALQDADDCLQDAYSLYGNVIDRTPFRLERLNWAFFQELARGFPVELSALIVETRGRRVATALLLHDEDECTFLLAGLDYEAGGGRAYPLLATGVLREALRRRARVLHMGQTSYPLKTRLGCKLESRYLYVRHRSAFKQRLLDVGGPWLFPRTVEPARRVFRR